MTLDPYAGPETEIRPLAGAELVDEVAYYRRTADQNGEPWDPEWERWLADDPGPVEGITAAFNEWEHVRGKDGRFLEMGGQVDVTGPDGSHRRATVTGFTPDGPRITYPDMKQEIIPLAQAGRLDPAPAAVGRLPAPDAQEQENIRRLTAVHEVKYGDGEREQGFAQKQAAAAFQDQTGLFAEDMQTQEGQDKLFALPDSDPGKAWMLYQLQGAFEAINDALRGLPPPAGEDWHGPAVAAAIPAAFAKLGHTTVSPITLYRGLKGDGQVRRADGKGFRQATWVKDLKVGTVFTDQGVTSTSAEQKRVVEFLERYGEGKAPGSVALELHVPAGTRVMGGYIGGEETMLPPGTSYRVISVEHRTLQGGDDNELLDRNLPYIVAEVLPPAKAAVAGAAGPDDGGLVPPGLVPLGDLTDRLFDSALDLAAEDDTALTAAFQEWQHLRGRNGRFLEMGGQVTVNKGGAGAHSRRGTVTRFTPGGPEITYKDDSSTETIPLDRVTAWVSPAPHSLAQLDVPHIERSHLSNPDTPRTRAVSAQEFAALAAVGRQKLTAMRTSASPPDGLDENWPAIKDQAWQSVQNEWGGLTVDAHTGVPMAGDEDKYALTVKPAGMPSVSVPIGASQDEFNTAMDRARQLFGGELANQQHYLGIFRDEDNNRIDIDPVLVVDNHDDVESIGAYTHAVGGAYNFKDGNGYWPPYVEQQNPGGENGGLQRSGAVAVPGGQGPGEAAPVAAGAGATGSSSPG